ncbi:phage tail protein [Herbaspirillum huttiense]|uniref:phage tail protein n=1 Tax=Herbaspirillum huttiense TaxID=863372 RepID=UPI003CED6BA6
MSTYFSIPTEIGEARIANALALGIPLKLTHMAVGDGNGIVPVPDRKQTSLIKEQRRAPINTLDKDPKNASQIIIEQVLPADVGGWWVREIGIFDDAGNLCAVANCPPSYKPLLSDGAGKDQVVRVVLLVSSTAAVELKIDPAVVLATRKYADDAIVAYAAPKAHTHADLAPLKSPVFTGQPVAPTPAAGADVGQVANIEFVASAIAQAMAGVIPFLTAIPAKKLVDVVMVKSIGLMEWVDVAGTGEFHGYRTLRCGALEFGTTAAPRSYEADLVGGLGSKTTQASIWAWAQQQGHVVAAGSWTTRIFKFADVDANYFRFPDLRNQVPRFTGVDIDSTLQRAIGSAQSDALQNITGSFSVVGSSGSVGGLFPGQGGVFYCPPNATFSNGNPDGGAGIRSTQATFDASRVARTSSETRPANTAFAPRIHL